MTAGTEVVTSACTAVETFPQASTALIQKDLVPAVDGFQKKVVPATVPMSVAESQVEPSRSWYSTTSKDVDFVQVSRMPKLSAVAR